MTYSNLPDVIPSELKSGEDRYISKDDVLKVRKSVDDVVNDFTINGLMGFFTGTSIDYIAEDHDNFWYYFKNDATCSVNFPVDPLVIGAIGKSDTNRAYTLTGNQTDLAEIAHVKEVPDNYNMFDLIAAINIDSVMRDKIRENRI